MPRLPRLLAPVTAAAAVAALAPAAQAATTTATFPSATVVMTDAGPSSPTVHLVATATDPAHLADLRVFLGQDSATPDYSIGVDGVRDADYDTDYDGELSTLGCSIYDSTWTYDAPVTATADSLSVDLPKGEIIAFESSGVAVGDLANDVPCSAGPFHGVEMDYPTVHETIDGFSWDAPAAPVVTTSGGRRSVTLRFAQERGAQYDIYRVVDGVREATPYVANVRGEGSDVPVVIDQDAEGKALEPGTTFRFQVQATRLFNVWQGEDMIQPTSPFSEVATVSTAPVQTVQFVTTPAALTTETTAVLTWVMAGNDAGDAPFCLLDGRTEVTCTTTGASLTGLGIGQHTLAVYPADGEGEFSTTWSITAPAAATPPAAAPTAPQQSTPVVVPPITPSITPPNPADRDGDGIKNTWLIGGKPAAAPQAPKAKVGAKAVTLQLPKAAAKGAKNIRVYRAEGKSGFKLVGTTSAKGGKLTDKSVKPGRTYRYKSVAVNAKGQQGSASKPVTVKVRKKKK